MVSEACQLALDISVQRDYLCCSTPFGATLLCCYAGRLAIKPSALCGQSIRQRLLSASLLTVFGCLEAAVSQLFWLWPLVHRSSYRRMIRITYSSQVPLDVFLIFEGVAHVLCERVLFATPKGSSKHTIVPYSCYQRWDTN